jgi:hypothetical protein
MMYPSHERIISMLRSTNCLYKRAQCYFSKAADVASNLLMTYGQRALISRPSPIAFHMHKRTTCSSTNRGDLTNLPDRVSSKNQHEIGNESNQINFL